MKALFIFTLCCQALALAAQLPEVQWKKCYGGSQIDYGKALAIDAEGFIYLCGSTSSSDINFESNNGSYDCALIKLNQDGEVIWTKTFGGSSIDRLNDVIISSDSNILVIGYTYSNDFDVIGHHGSQDILAIKLNLEGDIIWTKCFGGTLSEEGLSIIETSDGDFLIGGESQSFDGDLTMNYGADDVFIMLIDSNGNLIWAKTYGGTEEEDFGSMKISNANKIIVTGASRSNDFDITINKGFLDLLLLEINLDGEILTEHTYGSNKTDMGYGLIEATNKSQIFGGRCGANNFDVTGYHGGVSDYWVGKIDSLGEILWQLPLGGGGTDYGYALEMQLDSNILIVGESTSNNGNVSLHYGTASTTDLWFVILDKFGNFLVDTSFGGTENDAAFDILIVDSLNYFLFGHTASSDFDVSGFLGIQDMWLIKIGPSCNTKYFADADGDGFGDIMLDSLACELPVGYVLDSTDCNDLNPEIHPILTDICNAIDDNCNGLTDEDATFVTYFADIDDDSFGDVFNDSIACFELEGYVINNEDCNDLNAEINPLVIEICNAIDDNCNTDIDEGLTIYTLYADADGDTFGNPDAAVDTCIETIAGYVNNSFDCNDTIATIYPGATELCNYLDDDCDGLADENLTYILSYQDNDGDDFGNPLNDSISCTLPFGYVEDNTDCDDTNPDIFPGATEILNGLDDDCDQIADEGLSIENLNNIICSISPNPSFDIINIVSNINSNGLYEIISATGQVVLFGEWDINNTSISIINIPAGVYNLRLLFNDNIAVLSFIKIN